MSGTEHKKSRPLYVANYLKQKSDSDHWVTQKEILDYLYEEFEIMPDRKTIKRDIAMLRDEMGMDIEEESYKGYRLLSREFELDDLKILAECVYAAKFISEEKSKDLIDVLCDFCSENQAKRLKREIYLCDRIKTSENKTYTIKAPQLLKEEEKFIPYILRGIIDGDGCVSPTSYGGAQFFIVTMSEEFANWIVDVLENKLYMIDIHKRQTESGIWRIETSNQYNILKLIALVYNKPFGMMRKYNKLRKTFRDYNNDTLLDKVDGIVQTTTN